MIYLNIPSYPDPQSASPINAFAKINNLEANFLTGYGKVTLGVYRSVDALTADALPFDNIFIQAGGYATHGNARMNRVPNNSQPYGPQNGTAFPTLAVFATAEAAPWAELWNYILSNAILMGALSGATVVIV